MVRVTLEMALDFAPQKNVPYERYSYRIGDVWYVAWTGPRYMNVKRVIEADDEGVKWLQSIERREGGKP